MTKTITIQHQDQVIEIAAARLQTELQKFNQLKGDLYWVKLVRHGKSCGNFCFMMNNHDNAKFAVEQITGPVQASLIKDRIISRKKVYHGGLNLKLWHNGDIIYHHCMGLF